MYKLALPASQRRSRLIPAADRRGCSAETTAAHLSTFCPWPSLSSYALSSITKDATVFSYEPPTRISHD
jgi:hypothetical protein